MKFWKFDSRSASPDLPLPGLEGGGISKNTRQVFLTGCAKGEEENSSFLLPEYIHQCQRSHSPRCTVSPIRPDQPLKSTIFIQPTPPPPPRWITKLPSPPFIHWYSLPCNWRGPLPPALVYTKSKPKVKPEDKLHICFQPTIIVDRPYVTQLMGWWIVKQVKLWIFEFIHQFMEN